MWGLGVLDGWRGRVEGVKNVGLYFIQMSFTCGTHSSMRWTISVEAHHTDQCFFSFFSGLPLESWGVATRSVGLFGYTCGDHLEP